MKARDKYEKDNIGGFTLIFPPSDMNEMGEIINPPEEDQPKTKAQKYLMILEKSKLIWENFTTGAKKKKDDDEEKSQEDKK